MEDQQPVTGALTEVGDDEAPADAPDPTEALETGQPEPTGSGIGDKAPRKRRGFKLLRTSRPNRRRRREGAVEGHDESHAPEGTLGAVQQDPDAAVTGPSEHDDNPAPESAESFAQAAAESADGNADFATDSAADGEDAGTEQADSSDETVRARKPTGKWLAATVLAAATVFIGSAAFAGATVQPYLADRAALATKLTVARTAANAITTLWSYTPDNLDKLGDRAATYLSGDFEAQYRKFVDALVAPNKQAQVSNSTVVTGAAVESLEGPNAEAIVYTNTTSTSPVTKNIPALRYLSYRLFMKRDHARWLVTRMTTITSLDLTPQL